jgi:hypothetical protein
MLQARKCIACHEAGHAVVCWWLGLWFEYVSVKERRLERRETDIHRADVDARIMYALAGALAEQRLVGADDLPPESQDAAAYDEAQALAWARGRDGFVIDWREIDPRYGLPCPSLLDALRDLTRGLLRHPTVWAGVQRLAHELSEHDPLRYDEVSAILEGVGLERRVPRELGPWFPKQA